MRYTFETGCGLALVLLLGGCQPTPAPPPAAPEPAPPAASDAGTTPDLAPHITGVDLGNAIGPDQRVVQPMLSFAPGDTLFASVAYAGRDLGAAHRIDVKWSFGPTEQPVLAESKMLAFTAPGVTAFSLRKPDGWTPGIYRLQVLLDGALVQTRQFEIPAPPAPAAITADVQEPTAAAPSGPSAAAPLAPAATP